MKKSFSARRVPRKIGQDDDEEAASGGNIGGDAGSGSSINRPVIKPRKSSALRTSFRTPTAEDDDDVGSGGASIIAPKKGNLSRIAVQRNALNRSSNLEDGRSTSRNAEDDGDRPSYSAASLQELRDSTPSTPRDLQTTDQTSSEIAKVANSTRELDLSSKFGTSLSRYNQPSAIPSATEIAEKKARRARLAKEQAADEFISLDPDDPKLDNSDDEDLDENVTRDETGKLILKPKEDKSKEHSRLVREDEEIFENFDEYTEPTSQLAFTRNSEAEAIRRRKQEIAAQIAEAEGKGSAHSASDNESQDSNDSERLRNEAFEAAQTRHGISASARQQHDAGTRDGLPARPRTPPKISPLPTLDAAIERLRSRLAEMQTLRAEQLRDMQALQREKVRLAEEEVRIQRALRETGEKFEGLRKEEGILPPESTEDVAEGGDGGALVPAGDVGSRTALEGVTPPVGGSAGLGFGRGAAGLGYGGSAAGEMSRGTSTGVENELNGGARGGLGFSSGGRGLESLGSSAVGTPDGAGMGVGEDHERGAVNSD